MAILEYLKPKTQIRDFLPSGLVTILSVQWHGFDIAEVVYCDTFNKLGSELFSAAVQPIFKQHLTLLL